MSKGFMYILQFADGSYYTESTKDLERKLFEHQYARCKLHEEKVAG